VERWRGIDEIPASWGRCVLTIGVFDGVHRGHQALVREAVNTGRALGLPTVLMLPFTVALSKVTAEEFVHDVIVDRLHAASVVVGENFRFGHRGAGSVELLRELGPRFGFTVNGIGLVTEPDSVTVTSTYVRSCIAAGDVIAAAEALGRPHRVEGFVVHGEGRGGSQLGYPTANLDTEPHAAIPADGIYAGWFELGTRHSPAAISIGTNPTFSGRVRTVEAFVIDEGGNFYGRRVGFDFIERLRDTEKFDSVEALIAQIDADVARTREVLGVG